jgi:hypothetical protein
VAVVSLFYKVTAMSPLFHQSIKNIQLKAEELAASINRIEDFIPVNSGIYIEAVTSEDALDLPSFNAQYNWMEPAAVQNWYKSSVYYKKYFAYKSLYRKWEKEATRGTVDDRLGDFHVSSSGINSSGLRRMYVLQKLIDLALSLAHNLEKDLEFESATLEAELYSYLTTADIAILKASGAHLVQPVSYVELVGEILRWQLLLILRILFKPFQRDLRQLFRSIIRFLFKNLNDECDAHNFLFRHTLSEKLVTAKHLFHDLTNNNPALKKYKQPTFLYT